MRIEDTRSLTKQGSSWCLIIPPKWLRLNKLANFNYGVTVTIEDDKITICPLRSKWYAKALEPTAKQKGSPKQAGDA